MSLSTKWVAILDVPTQLPMKYSDAELRNLVARATPLHQRWANVNTDRMKVVYRSSSTEAQANRPMLDGNLVSAEDHVAEIRCGFTEVYRELLASRDLMRVRRNGSYYVLFAQVPGVTQGTAGIDYYLLRLADPDRVPCVLLW